MRLTVEDILKRVGGYVDGDASTPTGTELTTRINYINRAIHEFAQSYDWNDLAVKTGLTAAAVSTVTLAMPVNFKKPMSGLYHYTTTTTLPELYELINKDEVYGTNPSLKFAYLDGNLQGGYNLIVPRGLPSGASLMMDIHVYPSSVATLSNVPQISDSEYLVKRTIAYVLEARADSRFPIAKADSEKTLAQMIENQNAGYRGKLNRTRQLYGFVIGED